LAAGVVEQVGRDTIQNLIRKRLFDPLGLGGGAFTTSTEVLKADPGRYAYPYALDENYNVYPLPRAANTVLDGAISGSGSAVMSIKAVSKYLGAVLQGLPTILSPETFARITAPNADSYPIDMNLINPFEFWEHTYGLGWMIGTYRGERIIFHNGITIGHSTFFVFFPDQQLSIGILQNQLSVSLFTHLLFAFYTYDQLMGFNSVIPQSDICFYVGAAPTFKNYVGLSTAVKNPSRYVGDYCNCMWRKINVKQNKDKTLTMRIGDATGLLYSQDGDKFLWFGESFPEPSQFVVQFKRGFWDLYTSGVQIDLYDEDSTPVYFKKGGCDCWQQHCHKHW